jgi:hypothetical protein
MQNVSQGTLQVKFGDQLLQGKYTVVPNLLLKLLGELGITPNELVFTLEVWVYWYEQQKDMFPTLNTIAERMNLSRRNVNRYVESLKGKQYHDKETGYVSKPYLQVHERYATSGGQLSNQYDFSGMLEAVTFLAVKKGMLEPAEPKPMPPSSNLASPPLSNLASPPLSGTSTKKTKSKKSSFEENEDSSKSPQKEEVRGEQAQPLAQKPTPAEALNKGEGQKRQGNPTQKQKTSEPKRAYIGKPLTQEEIDALRREGKNASGYTPLAQIPPEHWQKLENDARKEPLKPNGMHYNNCTRNAPLMIDTTIEEFTTLLGDEPANTAKNINRAAKLYRQLEMSEDEFRTLLYEAFDLAKRYPTTSIQKKRSDGRANRMPLFFAILEERAAAQ